MNILLLNGSPNVKGNTAFLLEKISEECRMLNAETEIVSVDQCVSDCKNPFCKVCSYPCNQSCFKDTKLGELFKKMRNADAIVFGTPVYFGSMTAQLKVLFDKSRVLRGEKALTGKKGAAVSVGASRFGGQETAVRAIHDMMLVQGMTIVGDGFDDFDAGHRGVCAQKPAENDENAINRARILAHRLVSGL